MKHIEQIQPEYAAGDLSRLLVSEPDATASAALTALLHNVTGCAIPPTADTPESEVEELVPLCLSILRRHWTTPLTALGDGTTPMSLADLMRRLIGDRVQGNEALGILPANDNIPTAVSALRERKIGGVPDAPDGVSLPRLLCDSSIADTITELIDDNIGWVMDKTPTLPSTLTKLVLNCKEMNNARIKGYTSIEELEMPALEQAIYDTSIVSYQNEGFMQDMSCTEVTFPSLRLVKVNGYGTFLSRFSQLQKAYFPALEEFNMPWQGGVVCECPTVEEIYMPALTTISTSNDDRTKLIIDCQNLKKVVFGKNPIPNFACKCFVGCTSLIHLEFAEIDTPLYLGTWTPTTALADNLSLFLSNFRLYIADRLSDNGSGKTLTLSQEVRDAIHSAGIDTIITNKGWTISPVPTQQ